MNDTNDLEAPASTLRRRSSRPTLAALVALALGAMLVALGLYLAPSHAYEIQRPFREHGEPVTGTLVAKHLATRTYVAGGRRGGTKQYEEPELSVQMPDGGTVTIDHLVLTNDYERLAVGDRVPVTLIRGDAARQALPKGPFYLLTSSVHADTFALLGWAFGGRPAYGGAIAAGISGLVIMLISGALVWDRSRANRRSLHPAAAAAS